MYEQGPNTEVTQPASCETGKLEYDTRGAALRGLQGIRARSRARLHVYRCDSCHGWHLGSSLGPNR